MTEAARSGERVLCHPPKTAFCCSVCFYFFIRNPGCLTTGRAPCSLSSPLLPNSAALATEGRSLHRPWLFSCCFFQAFQGRKKGKRLLPLCSFLKSFSSLPVRRRERGECCGLQLPRLSSILARLLAKEAREGSSSEW